MEEAPSLHAASRALAIPELVEAILADFNVTELVTYSRVVKIWRHLILTSPNLEIARWIKHQWPSHSFAGNILWLGAPPLSAYQEWRLEPRQSGLHQGTVKNIMMPSKFLQYTGPWQPLQLTQPPTVEVWITGLDPHTNLSLNRKAGVTLGDLHHFVCSKSSELAGCKFMELRIAKILDSSGETQDLVGWTKVCGTPWSSWAGELEPFVSQL